MEKSVSYEMIIDKNIKICDNLNNIQLKFTDYGHATSGCEWGGTIKNPPYTRLYYIIGGDPYITVDNGGEGIDGSVTRIPLLVGHCYLLPTGYSFSYNCINSMEQLYFHINLSDKSGADLLRNCNKLMEYEPGNKKISELLALAEDVNIKSTLALRRELYDSVMLITDKYNVELESANYSKCVLLAIEYIRSHLTLQLGVSELAANSFVSESTLSKKFKQEVGMTVGSYIDEAIIFEAEQMLCKNEFTVLEISEHFGFCDQFYFSRRFKEKFGETPQKYSKNRPI